MARRKLDRSCNDLGSLPIAEGTLALDNESLDTSSVSIDVEFTRWLNGLRARLNRACPQWEFTAQRRPAALSTKYVYWSGLLL